jgi:opacity protein-like surface antigen
MLAGLAVAMAGCSSSAQRAEAQEAVSKFHQLLDSGQFEEIYADSADDLKKLSAQSDFVALLSAVHRKLGTTRSAESRGWNVNYQTSGTYVTLAYKTAYARGEATEQFVFAMQKDAPALAGYHINSTALVVN